MSRYKREYFAGRYVAQEAKQSERSVARSGDHEFALSGGDRFKTAEVVNTHEPEKLFVRICRAEGLPAPVAEHRFHDTRKWRFDYAWPTRMVALEVEGGIWTEGRHTRGAGALADLEKYSEAAIAGWRIIYCTPNELRGIGLERVRRAIGA